MRTGRWIAALSLIVLIVAVSVPALAQPDRQLSGNAQLQVTAQPPSGERFTFTYIAQQDFERGYMFWISTQRTIWVLSKRSAEDNGGEWTVLPDTFLEGEMETDPNVTPPGGLFQPRRGFGKLWRDRSTGLQTTLGWGTTPEFDLTTPISYLPGPGNSAGRYLLVSLGRQVFLLNERTAGQPGGTWQFIGEARSGRPATATPLPRTATPVAPATAVATASPTASR